MTKGWLFFLGFLLGKASGGFHLFGSSTKAAHIPISVPPHPEPIHLPEGMQPVSTSTAVHFGEKKPAGLPPFPSGWEPDIPTSDETVSRAWALLPTLPIGATKYEVDPHGRWLAYHAQHMGTKKGVTVWRVRGQSVSLPA